MESYEIQNKKEKCYLDSKLQEKNYLVLDSRNQDFVEKRTGKDLVKLIRDSKEKDIWRTKQTEVNYKTLMTELEEIELGNRQIEEKVKMELMGIKDEPFKKIAYYISGFFDRLLGKKPIKAQDIMKNQLERVDSVAQGLKQASKVIDKRISVLETYYDTLTLKLKDGAEYRNTLLDNIKDTRELMNGTQKALNSSRNFDDKLKYNYASRKLRKNIQGNVSELKLANNNITNIKNELPFIDTFEDFCQTYSFALKESYQKIQTVKSHLTNVMGLYFEMMRTDHINNSMKYELNRLFEYTENMNNSLVGARNLILGVNKNEAFANEYEKRYSNLDGMMNDVFDSNSETFDRLESQVSALIDSNFENSDENTELKGGIKK